MIVPEAMVANTGGLIVYGITIPPFHLSTLPPAQVFTGVSNTVDASLPYPLHIDGGTTHNGGVWVQVTTNSHAQGSITFTETSPGNAVHLAKTVPLVDGAATVYGQLDGPGQHTITATYNGSACSSAPLVFTFNPAASAISFRGTNLTGTPGLGPDIQAWIYSAATADPASHSWPAPSSPGQQQSVSTTLGTVALSPQRRPAAPAVC